MLSGLIVVCSMFALWQAAIVGFGVPSYIVPAPLAVLDAIVKDATNLWERTAFTLAGAALGLAISVVFATSTAVVFSMNQRIAQATLPVLIAFRSMPAAAIAPIIMLFFGRGLSTSVAVVAIVTFFPLLVNLARGLSGPKAIRGPIPRNRAGALTIGQGAMSYEAGFHRYRQ